MNHKCYPGAKVKIKDDVWEEYCEENKFTIRDNPPRTIKHVGSHPPYEDRVQLFFPGPRWFHVDELEFLDIPRGFSFEQILQLLFEDFKIGTYYADTNRKILYDLFFNPEIKNEDCELDRTKYGLVRRILYPSDRSNKEYIVLHFVDHGVYILGNTRFDSWESLENHYFFEQVWLSSKPIFLDEDEEEI